MSISPENGKSIVRRFINAINEKNWDSLDELVAGDIVRHITGSGESPIRSLKELKSFLMQEAESFPDAREEVLSLIAEGDRVAAHLLFRGTQQGPLGPFPASGKALESEFLCFFRIDEGKIVEVWAAYDNLNALLQLGHICLPPQNL